ncbi:MAG: hypothetical protein M9916_04330 [Crocinitomicaceae bacterium]|nr:hypothetical protein [Crocinitomicaceae bacterium]
MIIYTIFFFLVIIAMLRYVKSFQIPSGSPWLMPIGFAIKFGVGLVFLYVYSYHYGVGELTADASAFMHDSKVLNGVFYHSPKAYMQFLLGLDNHDLVCQYLGDTEQWDSQGVKWFNDARNVLRLHSVIHFFSFGQQAIHLMVLSLISILGTRLMVVALAPFVQLSINLAFFAVLLMPNVLFWSSGILKEPIVIFSIGLFMYGILGNFALKKKVVLLVIAFIFLLGMKPYILLCAIPAIATYLLFSYLKNLKLAVIVLSIGVFGSLMLLLTPPLKPVVDKLSFQQFDFINIGKGGVFARADTCIYIIYGENMPFVIVNDVDSTVYLTKAVEGDYIHPENKKDKKRCLIPANIDGKPWKMYYDGEFSGSYVEVTPIQESGSQLIKNIPEALGNVFLRPYPSDPPHSMLKYFTIIESWGLLALFLMSITVFRRRLTRKELNVVMAMVVFSLVLALLIGWTTPVIGAIVRYKMPIQLVMMFITLIVFNPQKWKNG